MVIGSGRRVCDGRSELLEAILRETPCVLGVLAGEFLQNQKRGGWEPNEKTTCLKRHHKNHVASLPSMATV